MYQQEYFVLKKNGTYSEVLEVFGLATILSKIVGEKALRVSDKGTYFLVHSTIPLTENLVSDTEYIQLLPLIKIKGDSPDPAIPTVIDYEIQKERRKSFNQFVQDLRSRKVPDMKQQIENYEPKPHPDYDILSNIYQLKALSAYTKALSNVFINRENYSVLIKEILFLYSTIDDLSNESTNRIKKLEKKGILQKNTNFNALQMFNPNQGKGVNELKSNRLKNENQRAYWLREWLKMIGSFKTMTIKPIQISSRSFDTKIYVLCPFEIDFGHLKRLQTSFKPKLRGLSAVKLDIACLLHFCEIFILNLKEYQEQKRQFSMLINPRHFVSGFYTAYLKDLGQNKAVSNLSFLQLPTFVSINSFFDGQEWIRIIQEHESILRALREDATGSCIQMLHNYRTFLTSSEIEYFFEFLAGYSAFLMQEIAKGNFYIRPFSLKLMEELIMRTNTEFTPILRSDGFKNIAAAIRRSTISLMFVPKGHERLYDVRYGMAQELKQKSDYRDELIKYLSDFCASYNNETARVKEAKNKIYRPTVKQQDIEEVVRLIDTYGSGIVGRLLAAYGYALDRKDKIEETEEETQEEVENV